MKKKMILILVVLMVILLMGLGYSKFKSAHTFTLSEESDEEIQPLFGVVRVYGTQDTDVVFIDAENPENTYQIGYITPGMSETIKLERGKWYKVQAAGDITMQMVDVRIQEVDVWETVTPYF